MRRVVALLDGTDGLSDVDEEQDEVGHLGDVDHGVDVVWALDEGEAAALTRNYSHGALGQD